MAKLKAHGTELARFELAHSRLAYMSDGKVLRDCGGGWKLYRHLKADAGITMEQHVAKVRAAYENVRPEAATRAAFRDRMVRDFPCIETRVKVYTCISLMPHDHDGVWSELEDFGNPLSIEEVADLCNLYEAACAEGREEAEAKAKATPAA